MPGIIYDSADIAEHVADRVEFVTDELGHGTSVASVAAVNAPASDLIVVKMLGDWYVSDYPKGLLAALDFVDSIATTVLKRNYVINLSIGSKRGPRDVFSDPYESRLYDLLHKYSLGGYLKGIVVAAGNENYDSTVSIRPRHRDAYAEQENRRMHARDDLPGEFTLEINATVADTLDRCRVEVWYPYSQPCSITVTAPGGKSVFSPIGPDNISNYTINSPDGCVLIDDDTLMITYGESAPEPRWGRFRIDLADGYRRGRVNGNPLAEGEWTIAITGGTGVWDAYIWDVRPRNLVKATSPVSNHNGYKIRSGASVPEVVTVGAYSKLDDDTYISVCEDISAYARFWQHDSLLHSSSQGPARHWLQAKPDLYAVGAPVITALSRHVPDSVRKMLPLCDGDNYTVGAGTSLAAPLVSAYLAQLADRFPQLTHRQLKSRLLDECEEVSPHHTQYTRENFGRVLFNLYLRWESAHSFYKDNDDS